MLLVCLYSKQLQLYSKLEWYIHTVYNIMKHQTQAPMSTDSSTTYKEVNTNDRPSNFLYTQSVL